MMRSLFVASASLRQRLLFLWHPHHHHPLQPQLAWIGGVAQQQQPSIATTAQSLLDRGAELLQDAADAATASALWFAVPKKRRTRHKKRLRTTLQNRIPLRKNIVTDPRTGELTLRHRLPYNWFDYLPDPPAVELEVYKRLRRKRYLKNDSTSSEEAAKDAAEATDEKK